MIKLCLEGEYCQECPAFKCECVEETIYGDGRFMIRDFYIKCENRKQCQLIHDHVLRNKRSDK